MIKQTKFKNLFLIKNKTFKDSRGYFKEIIRENKLKEKFPFFVMSYSKKNVIRGIHIQIKNPQGKFITVIKSVVNDGENVDPTQFNAPYPKKLLPLIEKKVFKLQKEYNELIDTFYDM